LNTIWFTVKERKWKVGFFGRFSWTGDEQIWDSDNCTISLAETINGKCLIMVHSNQTTYSDYLQKIVGIRYMLGFEISVVPSEPKTEIYTARSNIPQRCEGPKKRWVVQLDDKHWIWEWVQEGKDITSSTVYQLYRQIRDELERPTIAKDGLFKVQVGVSTVELVPVIYQPSVDVLKNYVREIHCAKEQPSQDGSYTLEVSILFNNERLRQHGFLNSVYQVFRRLIYGRVMDLESFKIHVAKDPVDVRLVFEGIYSGNADLNADLIHFDKAPPTPPKRPVRYYFMNRNHPVVFINTSNHAMAEHDTNKRIWKWEYIPWLTDAPIKFGSLTRKELEASLKKK